MIDTLSPDERSLNMSKIRSQDTRPEKIVRSFLHTQGYRFRLYQNDLPGKPDIVLRGHKIAIFVHGCFWHRHTSCRFATMPKSSITYWKDKFSKTVQRDKKNTLKLAQLGWNVVIIWECQIRNMEFRNKLLRSLPRHK
jgi:DNA mismatch endonuclease, patch repair protein